MAKQIHLLSFLSLLLLSLWSEPSAVANGSVESKDMVRVGVILDLNSTVGEMAESCISMALSDFYAHNAHYRTRLSPYTRDSKDDVVVAAIAALDLMKNEEVHIIIGPQRSAQAKFVANLGEKAQVPIISFSATSPSISPTQNPFFIRTAQDDSSQVEAITAIVQTYGWPEVVPIYEDTDYGNGLIPYVTDAFQNVDIRVPYRSVISPTFTDLQILKELNKLMAMQTRVFLVHMTASLGSKLFVLAKEAEMMSEGYVWIVTDGLSNLLDPVGSKVIDSMQGVLGIRPYLPMSKQLEDFNKRWKSNSKNLELNLFGLWAYDTVWALAMSVEMVGSANSSFLKKNISKSAVDLPGLGISEMGPRLLNTILSTKFKGLSGEFQLVNGQLEPSVFEIFNVIGKGERIIGYWLPKKGISRELYDMSKVEFSTSMDELKRPIWPGDTTVQPKGWVQPITGKKLRIGVPPVSKGFTEFVKVEWDSQTNKSTFSGFSIDVFLAVLDKLPFAVPHEFIPVMKYKGQRVETYDDMLYLVKNKTYDAIVGDVAIVAHRSTIVDFTQPYSESGVSMVVLIKDDKRKNMWIFLKPLSWDLWFTTGAAFIFTGFVVWVLEHRINTDFRGPPGQQIGTIFWFSFSTLVFAHREKVVNNLSRIVLIVWVFVVLILSQSYTASLTSMLTVQRLQPSFADVKELKRKGYFVGYQKNSFMKGFLTKQLGFDESKLRPYSTPEQCHEALSNGSHNGGVAAIFDEIIYIKLILTKYCSKYTMVGPIYKTGGLGFAFPLGSPLVSYLSRAILNVTEDKDKMDAIERKYFPPQNSCQDQAAIISSDSLSLSVHSFVGLFIITGVTSMSSLLIYMAMFFYLHRHPSNTIHSKISFWSRVVEIAKHFDQKDLSSHASFEEK